MAFAKLKFVKYVDGGYKSLNKATAKRGLACYEQPPNTAIHALRNCLAQPVIYDSVYVCVC